MPSERGEVRIAGTRWFVACQAGYYVVTGTWPWVHMPSFFWLTGPKVDLWLVRMVGALAFVIGWALWQGARAHGSRIFRGLGTGSAAAFLLVDLVYVLNGTLSGIYLCDGALQLVFIGGWVAHWYPSLPWSIGQARKAANERPPDP